MFRKLLDRASLNPIAVERHSWFASTFDSIQIG